jgi:hypothetical protein
VRAVKGPESSVCLALRATATRRGTGVRRPPRQHIHDADQLIAAARNAHGPRWPLHQIVVARALLAPVPVTGPSASGPELCRGSPRLTSPRGKECWQAGINTARDRRSPWHRRQTVVDEVGFSRLSQLGEAGACDGGMQPAISSWRSN